MRAPLAPPVRISTLPCRRGTLVPGHADRAGIPLRIRASGPCGIRAATTTGRRVHPCRLAPCGGIPTARASHPGYPRPPSSMMKPAEYGGTSRETCAVCAFAHLVTLCGLRAHPSRHAPAGSRARGTPGCYALRPQEAGALLSFSRQDKEGRLKEKAMAGRSCHRRAFRGVMNIHRQLPDACGFADVFFHKGPQDVENLFLLPSRQLGNGIEQLPRFSDRLTGNFLR